MTAVRPISVLLVLVLAACQGPARGPVPAAERQLLLVDTHIDLPYRLYRDPANVVEGDGRGDFDWPRAHAGGLGVAFMSIYIPARVDEAGQGARLADHLIDSMEALAADAPDKFAMARSTEAVLRNQAAGRISIALGMENGGPLRTEAELEHFVARGIRYVGFAHSRSNHLADSSYDANERWGGLSPAGKALVGELNRRGVMIDVSHVSDRAFWQILELSQTPVIASHSSARHFTPGFTRNLSDEMIVALAEHGGVVQVNFGSSFLTPEARAAADAERAAMRRFIQTLEHEPTPADLGEFRKAWRAEHPFPYASLDDVLDHFDHIVAIAGIEHVGIGSDFEGVGDTLPRGLEDVSAYPNLLAGLAERGYDEAALRAIAGGNLMRVWRAVEAYAAAH